jgi:[1-hydroxy-2-(trimethylamino)ethyl]phosphonate dioxygenase
VSDSIVDEIVRLFQTRGDAAYVGEAVSQTEHALQSARLAETEGAGDSLVVAALLHDVGHILHDLPQDVAEQGIDDCHEEVGRTWLEAHFGPEVSEPVRLHVAAKRYLCASAPGYHAGLSTASQRSLELQGGPMSADEVARFTAHPHQEAAVRLRHWDDLAKVPGLAVPGLEHYRTRLAAALRPQGAGW